MASRGRRPISRSPGFTLVELLAVVAILSILAAMGVTLAAGAYRSHEVALTRRKVKAVSQAVLAYHRDTREAPPGLPVATAGDPDGLLWISEVDRARLQLERPPGWRGPYLEATEEGNPLEDAWRRPFRLRPDSLRASTIVVSSAGPDGVHAFPAPASDDIGEFVHLTAAAHIQYQDLMEESAGPLSTINTAIRRFNRDAVMSSAQRPFRFGSQASFVSRQVDRDGALMLSPLVIVNPGRTEADLATEWRYLVDDHLYRGGYLADPAADWYTDGDGRPYVPVGYYDPANSVVYPHYGPDPRLVVVEVRLAPPSTP